MANKPRRAYNREGEDSREDGMREIKFRAWVNNAGWNHEKRMAMPYTIDFERGIVACHSWHIHRMLEDCDWMSIKNVILMQYTGLRDKNGKEIYEGDILQKIEEWIIVEIGSEKRTIERTKHTVVVEWFDYLIMGNCAADARDHEVIGNIYENPDLLKPVKQ
jgi:uncharacterized phage protein (TIGR01671 family)